MINFGITPAVLITITVLASFMERRGEIRRHIRVKRDNLGDVSVDFLNQSNVLDHVVWVLGLVIIVDLLNQNSVPVQNRLDLLEAGVQ